jgi:hypothetical protein
LALRHPRRHELPAEILAKGRGDNKGKNANEGSRPSKKEDGEQKQIKCFLALHNTSFIASSLFLT